LGVLVFFAGGVVVSEIERLGFTAVLRSPVTMLVVGVAWLVVGTLLSERGAVALAWLVLPFLVVAIGSRSIPFVRSAGRFGDLSYGLYLWGFPVQQTVVLFAPDLPLVVDIVVVIAGAGGLALASWWLIERRAIALGRRLGERFRFVRSGVPVG
ncbi:MAG TPA: hypothetical protein VNS80_03375, partial [Pseudolysinimonas sp.]|nr:hypothetical protein [Pseudolysinimonas sp.]